MVIERKVFTRRNTWMRVAANSIAFKDLSVTNFWRCFVEGETECQLFAHYTVEGIADRINSKSASANAEGSDPRLWLEYYGDIEIDEEGKGVILLKIPPKN